MSGFPNFFMVLGPNTATGHTSAIIAAEKCVLSLSFALPPFYQSYSDQINSSINYALRILRPIFEGTAKSVEVKSEAEKSYVQTVQAALKKTVWNSGCRSVRSIPSVSHL